MNKFDIHANFWSDHPGNYWSRTNTTEEHLMTLLDTCWHLREPFYGENHLKIPVPSTLNGSACFYTNIVKASPSTKMVPSWEKDEMGESSFMMVNPSPTNFAAKFVDLILANKNAKEYCGSKEWQLVAFHALPTKDVPPPPQVMLRNLKLDAASYNYTADDFVKSFSFWNQHVIRKNPS